jgi:hypothetical protein
MRTTCRMSERGCPQPQQASDCQTASPLSRGSLVCGIAAAGDSRAPWQSLSARGTLPALPATRAVSDNTQQKKANNI